MTGPDCAASLTGIQLITVGIIVEVLMRTYYESQDKRPYRIRNIVRGGEVEEAAAARDWLVKRRAASILHRST